MSSGSKIRRGVFKSVAELEAGIARYIKANYKSAQPFIWTEPAKAIFEKLAEVPEPSVSVSAPGPCSQSRASLI
jgi:hypothetical protein